MQQCIVVKLSCTRLVPVSTSTVWIRYRSGTRVRGARAEGGGLPHQLTHAHKQTHTCTHATMQQHWVSPKEGWHTLPNLNRFQWLAQPPWNSVDTKTASRLTYYFDCTTDRNNMSGIRWSRMSGINRFRPERVEGNPCVLRLPAGGMNCAMQIARGKQVHAGITKIPCTYPGSDRKGPKSWIYAPVEAPSRPQAPTIARTLPPCCNSKVHSHCIGKLHPQCIDCYTMLCVLPCMVCCQPITYGEDCAREYAGSLPHRSPCSEADRLPPRVQTRWACNSLSWQMSTRGLEDGLWADNTIRHQERQVSATTQ